MLLTQLLFELLFLSEQKILINETGAQRIVAPMTSGESWVKFIIF